jgi:hypothetical protein
MFNNNKDKDYKKSNKDKNAISENRRGLGVNKVNNSNNKKNQARLILIKVTIKIIQKQVITVER